MKLLKRMLILNWHYIHKEIIEFESINFLTGKNASGKSTLIDAMQLLLLGDTAGRYFNKAANDKSSRTLIGYLKGELSDQDTSFNYIRNKDFSTHLAMEVFDDEKEQYNLIGFIADVVGDQPNHQFYMAEGQFPNDLFISHNKVKSRQEVKNYFRNNKIHFEFYNSNTQYRENFKFKMGQINENYFSLLKKAVPFTPITDIKAFITEFICDAENNVDITDMKDNIRYYERMREGAEEIERMTKDLEIIKSAHTDYANEKDKVFMYEFLLDYANYQNLLDSKLSMENSLASCKLKIEDLQRVEKISEERLDIFKEDIEKKRIQLRSFEPYKLKNSYEEKIGQLSRNISDLNTSINRNKDRLLFRLMRWQAVSDNDLSHAIREAITALKNYDYKYDLSQIICKINDFSHDLNIKFYQLKLEQTDRQNDINDIKAIIKNLEAGIKDYPESVVKLKSLLTNELSKKYDDDVNVKILCELIEIKDKRWTNAIEGYLNTQKFHLLVEPKYFLDALKIYDAKKSELGLFGVGLVDLEKISRLENRHKTGSLADEVETENKYAKAYVNYLLGQVIKCDNVEDIRNHLIGITDTCMLYKNYVASQMNPSRYKFPYIGQQASKLQIELRTKELELLQEEFNIQNSEIVQLEKIVGLDTFNEDIIEDYKSASFDYKQVLVKETELEDYNLRLSQIDTSSIFVLENEIQDIEVAMKNVETSLRDAKADIKYEKKVIAEFEEKLPYLMGKIESKNIEIHESYKDDFIEEHGLVRFNLELDRLGVASRIIDNFRKVLTGSKNKTDELKDQLTEKRSNFNRAYRRDLGITSEDNVKYNSFLRDLKETELPSFKSQIEIAIEKAQQEFQDDFISKLKSNIDKVDRQIKGLNSSLKHIRFGKDSYKFSVKPNPYYRAYYDMIMDKDLMEGYSLFSYDFREKHGDVINDLFKQIIDIGEGALSVDEREELEKNIQKYTDYRTYLDFDLIVTNDSGELQHLSKMIDKKSGGETQTPFYISVLASFSKVYRINHMKNNNTMRLIIFDEAFSKMDHERIEESLKLLRNMGFQALISAPTEKIANISPLADKTLCVLRNQKSTIIREYDIIKDWVES